MQQHLRWCQQQFSWIQWAETASDRANSLLPVWSKKRKAETYVEPARWGRQCQQKNVAVVSIQKYFRVFMLENVNYLPPCRFWRVMVHSAWLTGSEGSEYIKNCVETWNSTWFVNVCVVAIGLSQSPTRTFARAEQVGQPLSQTLTYRYNRGDCTKAQRSSTCEMPTMTPKKLIEEWVANLRNKSTSGRQILLWLKNNWIFDAWLSWWVPRPGLSMLNGSNAHFEIIYLHVFCRCRF